MLMGFIVASILLLRLQGKTHRPIRKKYITTGLSSIDRPSPCSFTNPSLPISGSLSCGCKGSGSILCPLLELRSELFVIEEFIYNNITPDIAPWILIPAGRRRRRHKERKQKRGSSTAAQTAAAQHFPL